MKRLLFVVGLLVPTLAFAQNPANFPQVPVCDIRADNNGDCYSDAVGDTVCVSGIVLAWKDFGARGPGAIWDPASGCTISIYDIENEPVIPRGMQVQVCGWVSQFSGLDEITDNPANDSQNPVVTITHPFPFMFPITPIQSQDLADMSPTAEFLESSLALVCGAFVDTGTFSAASANYEFVDLDGNSCIVRIDSDTDIASTPIPVGLVAVRGVVSQYDNFNSALCTGYQLFPRDLGDFTLGCTIAVDTRDWSNVKRLYR